MGRLCAAGGGAGVGSGEGDGSPAQTHQKQILCVTASLNLATAHDTTLIQPQQWTPVPGTRAAYRLSAAMFRGINLM